MDYIIYNGKNSYLDMDLIIKEAISIPFSNENVKNTPIEGRDGSLTERLGTYPDVEIPVKFTLLTDFYRERIDDLNIWFDNIVDNKLFLPYDFYRHYKVKHVKADNIVQQLKWYGNFTVVFVCQPFYYGEERTIAYTASDSKLIYQGNKNAKTKITVLGSGNITLTINNKNVVLTNIIDMITIDGFLRDAYRDFNGNFSYMNDNMSGDFPELIPGINIISWVGNVSKVEITYQETYR